MNLDDLLQKVVDAVGNSQVNVHVGYPPTVVKAPYVTIRPLTIQQDVVAVSGDMISWDTQIGVYCVGNSVGASWNLALAVLSLQGVLLGGNVLNTSVGYTGAKIEGNYETQVTVQTHQGAV